MIILWTIAFASPVFYYVVKEPGMSHMYSFGLIAAFCWVVWQLREKEGLKRMLLAGFLLGLIIAIRPVNALALLAVPFLLGSQARLAYFLQKQPLHILGAAGALILALSPQVIYFLSQSGSLWLDTYPGEHFEFAQPHILDFLFSYRKGFFLYTPVAFLALGGLVFLIKNDRYQGLCLLGLMLVLIYVLASWWSWWYGGSFSARVMVDYLVFVGLLLGYLSQNLSRSYMRGILVGLLVLFTALNQIQIYQYRYEIISYETMTKERYWKYFLRLDKQAKQEAKATSK